MEQCLEALGDPREQMSLEEKKKLGLFYFFTQVPPFLLTSALPPLEFEAHNLSSFEDPLEL